MYNGAVWSRRVVLTRNDLKHTVLLHVGGKVPSPHVLLHYANIGQLLTEGGKTYPKSESLCSAVPLMVLGRAHFLRWCIKEQNNIFFFFYEWNKVAAGDAAHTWQMASPCKLLVVIYVSAARSATLGKYSRKTYRCRGRGVMETIHYWLKCLGGVSAFLPTLNSSSRPSLSWGALVLWSLCRWPSREHTSSSVSPYRKYSSRAW